MDRSKIVSRTMFIENLRRFWAISLAGFVLYFFSGPYMLMTDMFRASAKAVNEALEAFYRNWNVGFMFTHFCLPLAAALCVFAYLNRVNSVGVVHSMPFSRKMLFISNYVSGLVLSIAPLIATWVIFVVMGAGFPQVPGVSSLLWLARSITIIVFTFSICVLACMVSGNGIIAFLTSGAFNFLVAVIMLCLFGYASRFLFGFVYNDFFDDVLWTHPWLKTLERNINDWALLIFLAVAVLVSFAAYLLYKNRKLERCGDSYVYDWMRHIIGFLIVFIAASATGSMFYGVFGTGSYVIGFIIGFIFGQMITRKTFHIFNMSNLKALGIYAAIFILVIMSFKHDFYGFEKKVPKPENVANVTVSGVAQLNNNVALDMTSDESKQAVTALHKGIVDKYAPLYTGRNDYFGSYLYGFSEPDGNTKYQTIEIDYTLSNGKQMRRSYNIPATFLVGNEDFEKIRNSTELRKTVELLKTLDGNFNGYVFCPQGDGGEEDAYNETLSLSSEEGKELLAALSDDLLEYMAKPYNPNFDDRKLYNELQLSFDSKIKDTDEARKYWGQYYGFSYLEKVSVDGVEYAELRFIFDDDFTRTVSFLKEKGYIK